MEKQLISVGRIVHFYPNGSNNYSLPNNMEFAPAIALQCFGERTNMHVMHVESATGKTAFTGWSIRHKDEAINENEPYWEWPTTIK